MYYTLYENVYLVIGATKSCLYDFNTGKLYRVNDTLSQKLQAANEGKLTQENVDLELKAVFDNLQKTKLLRLSKTALPHYIDEIRISIAKFDMAWIEITNRCNLRCVHCYNEADIHQDTVMSLPNYKRVIDKLIELGVHKIQIIGGEPFCEEALLKEMLEYTIGKFSFIEIFTNGTLVSTEWCSYLSEHHIHLALSVYSYDKNIHDWVTKNTGSWEKTNQTIAKLKKYNIPYRICNILMKGVSLSEKNTDLYQLSEEKDIVRMSGRADFSLLSDELIKQKLITPKTFETPIRKNFCQRLISGHNCFRNKLYIASNMDVYPCVMERRFKHGHMSKNGEFAINTEIQDMTKDKISECCNCEFRYACFDCRPNSLSGEVFEKPWYCTYDPIHGKWEDEDLFISKLKEKYL